MNIKDSVAIVTGAGSGIGRAVSLDLARRGARMVALADLSDSVLETAKCIESTSSTIAHTYRGDATDPAFRRGVFDSVCEQFGTPQICVPAAGIARDSIAVKMNKETGLPEMYPEHLFRLVVEVDMIAPVYWGMEILARIAQSRYEKGLKRWVAEEGVQGVVVFIGSISSVGIKGQVAYSASKAGLEGAAATLTKEANYFGVRYGVIHPGFTDTPMVRALGEEYIRKNILPGTQLGRLIRPDEISDAICFMISNSAVTGELWADAGWHPSAA